jgi:hypothetical protein
LPRDGSVEEPAVDIVARWIGQHVRPGARVLVEGPILGERLAWHSQFEVLGGARERELTNVAADYFNVARASDATPQALAHYLQTFAVEWIVGDRPEFRRRPRLLTHMMTVAGVRIYETNLPVNRMLRGGGTLQASENRIDVRQSSQNDPLVLSYHWHPALRCRPDCRIERLPLDIDRIGFILIPAPHPADLVVWNSYEGW